VNFWRKISSERVLTEAFIDLHSDKVDWEMITRNQFLSENFLLEYIDKIDWFWFAGHRRTAESFLEKVLHVFTPEIWNQALAYQCFSENFLGRHKKNFNEIHWKIISEHQVLSEKFILEHKEDVDWNKIARSKKVGLEILKNFYHKISWETLEAYLSFPREVAEEQRRIFFPEGYFAPTDLKNIKNFIK
jgi:hypothetical protein